jgi:signal transduction histidine kinase
MAREIHDTLAQGFTGIVLQLEAAEQVIDEDPSEALEHLDRARRLARESLQAARRSVWNLLPKELEERSLESALGELVLRYQEEGIGEVSLSIAGERQELPPDVQAALLRVSQESLTNVRKHAAADTVQVELHFQPDGTLLRIRDDGKGFNPSIIQGPRATGGMGLPGMGDRARLLGGEFNVISEEKRGTTIEFWVPT